MCGCETEEVLRGFCGDSAWVVLRFDRDDGGCAVEEGGDEDAERWFVERA